MNLLKNDVEDYKIVSFSIDPDFDTPEILQEYLDHVLHSPKKIKNGMNQNGKC